MSMTIRAEDAGAVSLSCVGVSTDCGYRTRVYCPACDQGGCRARTSLVLGDGNAHDDDVCVVQCVSSSYPHQGYWTCSYMAVYAGPHGAETRDDDPSLPPRYHELVASAFTHGGGAATSPAVGGWAYPGLCCEQSTAKWTAWQTYPWVGSGGSR